jgi:hypothetical protein
MSKRQRSNSLSTNATALATLDLTTASVIDLDYTIDIQAVAFVVQRPNIIMGPREISIRHLIQFCHGISNVIDTGEQFNDNYMT